MKMSSVVSRWVFLAATGALLAACGGGGGGGDGGAPGGQVEGSNCAGSGTIAATFDYSGSLRGKVGTSMSITPIIDGVPSACTRSMHFELTSGTLPAGLSLDSSTGVISGTPTASASSFLAVDLSLPNATRTFSIGIEANIDDPAARTLSGWVTVASSPPFGGKFRIAALGNDLYVLDREPNPSEMFTWKSSDEGATWKAMPIASPSTLTTAFALASDGSSIYMSGGLLANGTPSNQVWRFDGAAWTQVNVTSPFPARSGHAMVAQAGTLYIMGGRLAGTASFATDTWKSTDGGVTWMQSATSGFGTRENPCAVSDGTNLYVLGGKNFDTPVMGVFRSTDGAHWSQLPVASNSPLTAAGRTASGACAYVGGRIVYAGADVVLLDGGSSSVSSSNGIDWVFEPQSNDLLFVAPGAAVVGGRMYVVTGEDASARRVVRTNP